MRKLLVTGAAGFIGSNFVHHWLNEHTDACVALDALTYAGHLGSLHAAMQRPNFRFIRGNINDDGLAEQLLRDYDIDTIVHFAAESHVDRSIHGPDAFVTTNIVGTHSLLKAARKVWMQERRLTTHRFHHVSTDEVYGSLGAEDPAVHESMPYAPNSPYAASKAAADHLVRAYHHTYGLQVTTSNCSNNYGPYHFPEKLIPLAIVNILRGRPLPVYGDGRHVRDWLHVSDHCRAIDLILAGGEPGETYNIGGRSECENLTLLRILCALADEAFDNEPELRRRYPLCPSARGQQASSLISFVPDRPGHDRRYAIDCGKIERELGYRAHICLEDGLRSTLAWYLENELWWSSVMDGSYLTWIEAHYHSRAGAERTVRA